MHRHPAPRSDEPTHTVAGHRFTAFRQLVRQIAHTTDGDGSPLARLGLGQGSASSSGSGFAIRYTALMAWLRRKSPAPNPTHNSSAVCSPISWTRLSMSTGTKAKRFSSVSSNWRPSAKFSSRSCALNQVWILVRAREVAIKPKLGINQSRLGLPSLVVKISSLSNF